MILEILNTPNKYLIAKGKITDLNDLKNRFSLEVVNKDFYLEISNLFAKLTGGTFGSGRSKIQYEALLQLPSISAGDQRNLEFAVRLIGRIIFCWFLREKKSSAGVSLMPKELLSLSAVSNTQNYYHTTLEPIFFEILNKPVKSRKDPFVQAPFASIPYLNGGLFFPKHEDFYSSNEEKQAILNNIVVVPDEWFKEFFEFLETYNFTIDENVSFDEELSIDPEMLGRIFENLLAEINPETGDSARKSTGSYYTPRAVVDYMVDESLLCYLRSKTNIDEGKLRALISYDLEDNIVYPLSDKEYSKIVYALNDIKILDPACGSGAFPIGALQKIVFILQQVDPDSRRWFEKQIVNAAPEIKRVIEREFANKNLNYIRKLGIVRENIFGVDIQPIATEISRLRCFLTLVVDESIHDELENRGIEPLPNLDFKFVTANTLIPLPGSNNQTLFKDRERIDQLKELRNEFFGSTNSERQRLQLEFKELQNQMLNRMIETKGEDEVTRTLSTWNPFNHKTTPWFDSEWMFGVQSFDVVIGNPPYVSYGLRDTQKMSQGEKEFIRRTYPNSAEYKISLYALFMDKAIQLTNDEGGVQTFIVPDSFLLGRYFSKIRAYILKQTRILKFLLFQYGVFDATVGFSIVYFLQKTKNTSSAHELMVYSPSSSEDLVNNDGLKFSYPQKCFESTKYNRFRLFFDSKTQELIKKIETGTIELGSQYTGRTGVRSKIGQKNIVAKEKRSQTYQEAIVSGGQIKRYSIRYEGDYINIDPELLNSGGWDYDVIHNPKILIRQTGDSLIASIDKKNYYHLNNVHSFAPQKGAFLEMEYVLAILNSSLMNYFYQKTTLEVGRAMAQTDIETLESLPIRVADPTYRKQIIELVNEVLSKKERNEDADVNEQLHKIDALVFDIYDLSEEEKGWIKKEIHLLK